MLVRLLDQAMKFRLFFVLISYHEAHITDEIGDPLVDFVLFLLPGVFTLEKCHETCHCEPLEWVQH